MPGVVFLIIVPTAKFEREIIQEQRWDNNEPLLPILPNSSEIVNSISDPTIHGTGAKNLNINFPDNNAILRLEVELRDKNAVKQRGRGGGRGGIAGGKKRWSKNLVGGKEFGRKRENFNIIVPMEKVLEELLTKLEIDYVTWSTDKKGNYYHVVFPLQSGEPCETTLHCLTELGIGTKSNSSVSVLPCSVTYDAITNSLNDLDDSEDDEELSKWNNFVESIKSKLTVKQVVDGVRAGGSLSFDYILLIVTADSLAALGLVENNAPNIVAAMLVSPLMGPVMSITFGTMISDHDLIKVGFTSLLIGMFISLVFGFIFGLILGTTEMPWGSTDWPTEEMKGRGNVRSLWMGVVWALTSGTGVAVALLQGAVGPLIGVAISASLLPPVVNCGLFWALACIWLIYPDIKMPHIKGEPYHGNSSYEFIYTNYLPTEFFINGIVSGLLTCVNIICIFITAIIVLKIKEVSAPYTASPDLKRFWETDIRTVRKTNRSTIRKKGTFRERLLPKYQQDTNNLESNKELQTVLEQAIQEATEDETYRKVKRMSYSNNAAEELSRRFVLNKCDNSARSSPGKRSLSGSVRNSKLNADLQALDKLVSSLLEQHHVVHHTNNEKKQGSIKLNRFRSLSRSMTDSVKGSKIGGSGANGGNTSNDLNSSSIQHTSLMPTILEQQNQSSSSSSNRASKVISSSNQAIKSVLNTISNAPQRFNQSLGDDMNEENINLAQNIIE